MKGFLDWLAAPEGEVVSLEIIYACVGGCILCVGKKMVR